MTEEHKAAIKAGRARARAEKIASGEPLRVTKKAKKSKVEFENGKPVLYITGKEKDAIDFFTPVRDTFRMAKLHNRVPKILKEINDKEFWKNPNWVLNKLSTYATIKVKGKN